MRLETFKTRKGADKRCAELRRMWPDKAFEVVPQPSGFLHCIALLDASDNMRIKAYVQKTAPLKTAWARARFQRDCINGAISNWAFANDRGHTPWNALLQAMPADLRRAWEDADADVCEIEGRAVRAHKAWRGPYNALTWYK